MVPLDLATRSSLGSGTFKALLDKAENLIYSGEPSAAIRLLGSPLASLTRQARSDPAHLADLVREARNHKLFELVQQDPYTQRAYDKPRGYAGDAVMLDYVYAGVPPSDTTATGRDVFAATTRSPMGLSVLYRRALLRSYIDDVVARRPDARILSVASGHCRELEGSLVESPLFKGEFIALDQDALSCNEVRWRQNAMRGNARVSVVESSVKALLGNRHKDLGRFDLIYAAGLYDYLSAATARKLTAVLGSMCGLSGRLLIANFVPDGYGRGYMELFMDWHLIVRDDAEMAELAQLAGNGTVTTFRDPHDNVAYAEWRRAG